MTRVLNGIFSAAWKIKTPGCYARGLRVERNIRTTINHATLRFSADVLPRLVTSSYSTL